MIAYLHGALIAIGAAFVVIEVGGVGYKVFLASSTVSKLPPLYSNCRLWISHLVREQSEALYGFLQQPECDLFETLIAVNGVGPKLALSILGHLGQGELLQALANGDTVALSTVPGIGKKTAQRLIVEMQGKLDVSFISSQEKSEPPTSHQRLAVNALVNLGYSEAAAYKAVQRCPPTNDLPALIAAALQHF